MGGKSSTSTQTVSIPPEVLARYNAVNARAESVAATPFQQYGGQFVAGLTPVQQQGIQQTSQAATLAQPYYGLGAAYTMSGAQDVGPLTRSQIGYYESPYTQAVAAPTYQALRQQQGQELAQQQAQAIRSGAAFGDRAGLERANLMRQQGLGTAQAMAPIFQQGYGQAVQTAQQQQGVIGQDLARRMQAGQQIAGLGTGAQQAALQGAQAALQAGTAEQQTQQADLTARYQQFLQERGYPFQVAQFLANIAMGTGALSGSTTTTTQPAGFFSDKRLKHDAHRIGETDDGIPIYSFKYNGDDKTQIGLMAQDVEKRKPEAVGLAPAADGKLYKTVDYEKATRKGRDFGGMVDGESDDGSSMGGAVSLGDVMQAFARGGYAVGGGGGLLGDTDIQAILKSQQQFLNPYAANGPYGQSKSPGGQGYVPQAALPTPKLVTAGGLPQQQRSGLAQAASTGQGLVSTYKGGKEMFLGDKDSAGLIGGGGKLSGKSIFGEMGDYFKDKEARGGLIVPRHHYDDGGDVPGQPDEEQDNGAVNPAGVPSSGFAPGVLESGSKHAELAIAKGGPGGGGGSSGLKDVASAIGAGKTLFDAGKFLIGLFEEGGRVNPYAYGGLVPREHHAVGEAVGDAPQQEDPSLALIRRREGFRETPYYDVNAHRVGYGSDTITTPEGKILKVTPDVRVSRDDAERDLNRRVGEFQGIARTAIGDEAWNAMHPQARAALTSLTYNYGRVPEPVARAAQSGDMSALGAAVNALGVHNKGINAGRRAEEASLIDPEGKYQPPGLITGATGSARRPGIIPSGQEGIYAGVPSEKASIGDVAREYLPKGTPTDEKFWVPALGFLGSMLASKSPFLGQAIGEGLVGGVGAYTALQRQESEIAKRAAETELTRAEVPLTAERTKAITAGLYERRWIPNRGWQVYDKSNNTFFYVTDANLNPIKGTGLEKNYDQIPVSPGGAKPAGEAAGQTGESKTQQTLPMPSMATTVESDISKLVPPPKNVTEWTPVTSVPKGYEPKTHMDIQMDPDNAKKFLDEGIKTLEAQSGKAEAAGKQRLELEQMMDSLNKLPQKGLFGTTGTGAETRLQIARGLNTAGAIIGGKSLTDPNYVAAQEQINKGSFRLGAALANSIGSREPGFIVAQSVSANPTIENSPEGFKLLAAGLLQSAKYEEDKAKFYDSYMAQFKHLSGAKEAFDKVNPPELYAQRAVISAVDPAVIEDLRKYGPDQMRGFIDKKYGTGITNILMGKK